MTLIETYYYLFYTYYRLFESFKTTRWLTDMKATIAVSSLEIWILLSVQFYYNVLIHKKEMFNFFSFKILTPFIVLFIIKWAVFLKDSKWKKYAAKFDNLPNSQNNKRFWIVGGLTLISFANLIYSLYLYTLI